MPSGTKPCARCKERHEKCDDQQPRCSRCEKRGVECHRPQRKSSFRQGSTANYEGAFTRDQHWVNSRPRAFRFDSRANKKAGESSQPQDASNESPASNASSLPETRLAVSSVLHETVRNLSDGPDLLIRERRLEEAQPLPAPIKRRRTETAPHDGSGSQFPVSPAGSGTSGASPWSTTVLPTGRVRLRDDEPPLSSPQSTGQQQVTAVNQFSPSADSYHPPSVEDAAIVGGLQPPQPTPNDGIQEACLLRYFVEELSPWFDLCDDERHFQLVVARRARQCQPLRDAVFAVAARHLCRHPRFRVDPSGSGGGGVIMYQNQPLPDLTPQSAFEYMLRCIPALHEVSRTQDEEYRENLAAAALILRQFEEMDPEDAQGSGGSDFGIGNGNVNFLDITKAILRAAPSRWSGLLSAVYWVAVRQEIYFALTLERSPQITAQPPDLEREACFANKLIWFMSEVAKWKMGDRTEVEWERLKHDEEILALESTRQFIPLTQRPADRSRGEIFPLVWYGSDVEVTAQQHFILARMILVAEDPSLHRQGSNRRAQRDAEHQVRAMILELCGLALHHLRAAPNLTTAGMGIMLYGDYFNDPWERAALLGVLEEWKSQHAWPVRKGYEALGMDYAG
ncbi:ArcA-like protein [Colletotrichum truncatum]|uniref:ArcA-like protein n=1 Tax=Colletotrichum truncatum TaxID=5467 RepID=A0ACC3YSR2_COLTU